MEFPFAPEVDYLFAAEERPITDDASSSGAFEKLRVSDRIYLCGTKRGDDTLGGNSEAIGTGEMFILSEWCAEALDHWISIT